MDKRSQTITSIIILIGFIQLVVFDMWYSYDWLGVNEIMYLHKNGQNYSWGELLVNSDQYILLIAIIWTTKRATPLIKWMKYVSAFMIDLVSTGLIFCIVENPYSENWDKTLCVIISCGIFIAQLLLYRFVPAFRKLKLF